MTCRLGVPVAVALCLVGACASGGSDTPPVATLGQTGGQGDTSSGGGGALPASSATPDGTGSGTGGASSDATAEGSTALAGSSGSSPTGSSSSGCGELFSATIYIDWAADCTGADGFVVTPDMPPGKYLATAVDGGGTEFPPPWDPPDSGWAYILQCTGIEFNQIRTTSLYENAAEAFANIQATNEEFSWEGGDLTCALQDTNCANNQGFTQVLVEQLCD